MKKALTILFLVISSGLFAQVKLWVIDPLEPVYPDSNVFLGYSNSWYASFPQGMVVDVHLAFKLPVGEPFAFTAEKTGKTLRQN